MANETKSFSLLTKSAPIQTVTDNSLQQSMSGQALSPPGSSDLAPYDAAIADAHKQLNDLLGQFPEIDYEGKYKELLSQTQNQPTAENPLSTPGGVASSFAYALGAPASAPALIKEKVDRARKEEEDKQTNLMKLKESLVQGAIQQEVAKGNFKMALKQSEVLDNLQRANADRDRFMAHQAAMDTLKAKNAAAKEAIYAKMKAKIISSTSDPKVQVARINAMTKLLDRMFQQKNIIGEPVTAADYDSIAETIMPDIEKFGATGEGKPKPKEETTPGGGGAKTNLKSFVEEFRKKNKK